MLRLKSILAIPCISWALLIGTVQAGIPPYEQMDAYWHSYFSKVDRELAENFWGNLLTLEEALAFKDPYLFQLQQMGYQFSGSDSRPAPFYQSIKWIFDQIDELIASKVLNEREVLRPAKAFQVGAKAVFVPIGFPVPEGAKELNILMPDVFVEMLSEGYFPIGEPIREHTNQTLAEHDLAHMAGFISSPRYMKAIRLAFQEVGRKMKSNPRLQHALHEFDSLYSLRLYYMAEVFTIIREDRKNDLQRLIGLPLHQPTNYAQISEFLLDKAQNPSELNKYLYELYKEFPSIVDPVGGESRDILNRVRKFQRGSQQGSFYSMKSNLGSKFDGSSIYSLYQNAMAALSNKRSNHSDYIDSIKEIHAPFIGTLIGTSQLSIEDWVMEAIEEVPNKNSKLYRYLCGTEMWDRKHVIFWAYCSENYDMVLKEDGMN